MEQAYNDKVDRKRNKRKRKRKLVAWAIIENRYYENDIYFDEDQEFFLDYKEFGNDR
jgi:hypothetical protein